jgi:hypothetical protein
MNGFDAPVQTTVTFALAVRSAFALVTTGSYAFAESLQVFSTVTVMESGLAAEPAMVDRVGPNVASITIKKKMN